MQNLIFLPVKSPSSSLLFEIKLNDARWLNQSLCGTRSYTAALLAAVGEGDRGRGPIKTDKPLLVLVFLVRNSPSGCLTRTRTKKGCSEKANVQCFKAHNLRLDKERQNPSCQTTSNGSNSRSESTFWRFKSFKRSKIGLPSRNDGLMLDWVNLSLRGSILCSTW